MIREAKYKGQFYEEDKEKLIKQIEDCFLDKLGIGKLPKERNKNQIFGVIVPHAGYVFSGPCASYSYYKLKEDGKKDVYVILGVNHHGYSSAISDMDFETPLGIAENDLEITKELAKILEINNQLHNVEHSIEVQIPFLQYLFGKIKIVPIIVSDLNYNLVKKIIQLLKEKNRSFTIIASGDFTHYGWHYGYYPFGLGKDSEKQVEEFDLKVIELIKEFKVEELIKLKDKTTICGIFPFSMLIALAKEYEKIFNKKINVELLKYYTSNKIYPSNSFVGYASIIFKILR